MFRLGSLIVAIISYSAAAMISSHVPMDVTQTDWLNLWTYFWWALSLPVIGSIAFIICCAALHIWREIF